MADISFNIACKELKITQIGQLNQLFQLLHLVHIYGHSFNELSRMLMMKNVNNEISKDSPFVINHPCLIPFHFLAIYLALRYGSINSNFDVVM